MKTKLASYAFAGFLALGGSYSTFNMPKDTGRSNLEIRNESTTAASPKPSGGFRLGTKLETAVQHFKNSRATLTGSVTAVGSSTITVSSNGASIQVDVTGNTHFRRKFWGSSSLSEISVGDSVQVVGKWTSDAKTEITAVLIRDISIQKRFGVFFGTVKSLTSGGFVVTTIHRDDETVTIGSAKLINRKGAAISGSDIQVGQKVRVRGMWDSTLKTITEVTEIKDFSLPPFASPTPGI